MNDKIPRLVDQVFRLVYVVRNVAHHRSLQKYKDEFNQNYWIIIFNNFLDIAVLEWCKVFGSRNEATHWSNHVKDQDTFRQELLSRLKLSQEEWGEYWESIKEYRDNAVAHHGYIPNGTDYPDFSYALVACYYYYEILINELRSLKVYDYPDDLEKYFNNSLAQATEFSNLAYQSTIKIEEQVY